MTKKIARLCTGKIPGKPSIVSNNTSLAVSCLGATVTKDSPRSAGQYYPDRVRVLFWDGTRNFEPRLDDDIGASSTSPHFRTTPPSSPSILVDSKRFGQFGGRGLWAPPYPEVVWPPIFTLLLLLQRLE
ncbi:hypothetical protein AVEN_159350-1 [Araneus ventricosus]|uniref:Uncharacterized protein n=1 Tax=Araneus ventricosus TaxID=182803 RepID=A0A4Y2A1R3_ARAVE|nr:hypothetical protein AVEN_159350-1 [Araneus ventricosus]